MRPNIQISHELNGRVKDWAAEHGLSTSEAYRIIIEAGVEQLGLPEVDIVEIDEEEHSAIYDCPCGASFDRFEPFHEHVQEQHPEQDIDDEEEDNGE